MPKGGALGALQMDLQGIGPVGIGRVVRRYDIKHLDGDIAGGSSNLEHSSEGLARVQGDGFARPGLLLAGYSRPKHVGCQFANLFRRFERHIATLEMDQCSRHVEGAVALVVDVLPGKADDGRIGSLEQHILQSDGIGLVAHAFPPGVQERCGASHRG